MNDPANTLGPVNIERAKKICACVPFIDNGSGVMETQDCIRHLIAELEFLRNICIEVDALKDSVKELEVMVYHTPPGQMEYAPEGWTWQQQCNSERGRYAELESECIDQSGRVAHLQRVVKLLREEVNCSRVNLIREEHPNGGTVAPFYSLNTHGTQADDCNYADARAAVDDAKALTDPVLP